MTLSDSDAVATGPVVHVAGLLLVVFAAQKFLLYGAKGYFVRAPEDFASYYLAAKGFLQGVNPYDTERLWKTFGLDAGVFHPFLYPPSSLLPVLPLTVLPPQPAGIVFLVGSAALLFTGLYLFATLFFEKRTALTLAAIGFAFQPITSTFLIGQINALVLGLIALAIYFRARGREMPAAVCVAAGVGLKLTPIFLLLFFLLRREVRLVARTTAYLAILLAASVLVFGWDRHMTYLLHFARAGGGTTGDAPGWLAGQAVAAFENQGLNGFLSRLLVPSYVAEPLLPRPDRFDAIFRAIAGLTAIISLVCAARARRTSIALGIVLCLALLVTPVSWFHTFGTLYLILIVLLRDVVDGRGSPSTWVALCLLIFFFHGGTANLASILDPANYRSGIRSLALSLPFFCLAGIWGALLFKGIEPLNEVAGRQADCPPDAIARGGAARVIFRH